MAEQDNRVFTIPGVDDERATFETYFKWPDFTVCGGCLLVSLLIGVNFGILNISKSLEEYLTGDRKLQVIPVAFSLSASFVSGLLMLKIPSETYMHGMQHLYLIIGHVLMTIVMTFVFLPVLYCTKSISIYEYLERRFDKRVRLFGSLLFIISMIAWLPVVISVPILAFSQVTDLNISLITTILCVICIFNTSLGGIKSVVWTDTFHTILIIIALTLITILGTVNLDPNVIIDRNLQSTRIEPPNLDFWSLTIGGCIYYLHILGTNQNIFQKYASLPSLKSAKIAAWLFVVISSLIFILLVYCGFLLYASFYDCDPLTTKLIADQNQLLPLLVVKILGGYPGLSGLFVAGIFSACLSSWSTTLNALTTVVVEDFYPVFFAKQFPQKPSILLKLIPLSFAAIFLCLIFVYNDVGFVLEISEKIVLISAGPLLGIFTIGITLPWVNTKGALTGGISSLIFMVLLSTELRGLNLTSPEKPVSTDGCRYHFTPSRNSSNYEEHFFHVSYLWSTLTGSVVMIVIALSLSWFKGSDPRDVDPSLLAPGLRRLIKPREFPNEPGDGIIYAYYSPEKRENSTANVE